MVRLVCNFLTLFAFLVTAVMSLECSNTTYGEDCSQNCSRHCLDQVCDKVTGHCHKCPRDRSGDFCRNDLSYSFIDPESETLLKWVAFAFIACAITIPFLLAALTLRIKPQTLEEMAGVEETLKDHYKAIQAIASKSGKPDTSKK